MWDKLQYELIDALAFKNLIKVVVLNQRTLEICSRSLYHYELLRSGFASL